jgi:hypothetical protein
VTQSGDAPFYIELAWNWLKNGVYGFPVNGQLTPVDMRVPGYPAFLAAIFAFAGKSPRAVMLAQAVVDVAGCLLIALIAERLAPAESRRRAFIAGLWLAVSFHSELSGGCAYGDACYFSDCDSDSGAAGDRSWTAGYERCREICRKWILRESVGIGGDRGGIRHIGAAGNTTAIDFGGTRIVREMVASAGLAKAGASGNLSWIGRAAAACAVGGEKLEGAAQSAVSCTAL